MSLQQYTGFLVLTRKARKEKEIERARVCLGFVKSYTIMDKILIVIAIVVVVAVGVAIAIVKDIDIVVLLTLFLDPLQSTRTVVNFAVDCITLTARTDMHKDHKTQ